MCVLDVFMYVPIRVLVLVCECECQRLVPGISLCLSIAFLEMGLFFKIGSLTELGIL